MYDGWGGGVDDTGSRDSCGPLDGDGRSIMGQVCAGVREVGGVVVVFRVVVVVVVDVVPRVVVEVEDVEDGLLSVK